MDLVAVAIRPLFVLTDETGYYHNIMLAAFFAPFCWLEAVSLGKSAIANK